MKSQHEPERKQIKNFNYEIDEDGNVFNMRHFPGYGKGRQVMPTKPGKTRKAQYTLSKHGKTHVFRVDILVEKYFCTVTQFGSAWYLETRKNARKHNALLRAQFLEDKKNGNSEIENPAQVHPTTAPMVKSQVKKVDVVKDFAPWSGNSRFNSVIADNYLESTGFDVRDARFCPLG